MIDLHCHALPGVDDGPANLGEALQLAKAAADAGTGLIVATPHVNHTYTENTAESIAAGVADLQHMYGAAGLDIELRAGGEVALTRALELSVAELTALRLGGGPYLLVECPSTTSTAGFAAALDSLQMQGHRILLAHVERIPAFQRDLRSLEDLIARGMLGQVTAASVSGRFGEPTRAIAEQMLRAGLVHDIASDAHAPQRRGPGIAAHLQEGGWGTHVQHFAVDVPLAILNGTPVPPCPPPPARRGGGSGRRGLFRRG